MTATDAQLSPPAGAYTIRVKLADNPESSRGVVMHTHVPAEMAGRMREDYERAGSIVFADREDPGAQPDEAFCPETSDGQHCGHWYEGGKCCACGQTGPEPDDEAGAPMTATDAQLSPPEHPGRPWRENRPPPGHLLPAALLTPFHDLHGPQCGETDSNYRCTAQPGHGGLLHVAFSVLGEICHTWPLTGAPAGSDAR